MTVLLEAPVRQQKTQERKPVADGAPAQAVADATIRRKRIVAAAERVRSGKARGTNITNLSDAELRARFFGK